MCTTRHFAIALVSAMIREEISIASMILDGTCKNRMSTILVLQS